MENIYKNIYNTEYTVFIYAVRTSHTAKAQKRIDGWNKQTNKTNERTKWKNNKRMSGKKCIEMKTNHGEWEKEKANILKSNNPSLKHLFASKLLKRIFAGCCFFSGSFLFTLELKMRVCWMNCFFRHLFRFHFVYTINTIYCYEMPCLLCKAWMYYIFTIRYNEWYRDRYNTIFTHLSSY